MTWHYKGYDIVINDDGYFTTIIDGYHYSAPKLIDIEKHIDKCGVNLFTHFEIDDLVYKLSEKEKGTLYGLIKGPKRKVNIDIDYLYEKLQS